MNWKNILSKKLLGSLGAIGVIAAIPGVGPVVVVAKIASIAAIGITQIVMQSKVDAAKSAPNGEQKTTN